MIQTMIDAVRADPKVGRGTCSSIDECYEQHELAAALTRDNITTAKAAVKWARGVERLYREREREIRAEIF